MEDNLDNIQFYADLINNLMPIFLIIIGYITGSIIESKHYKNIKKREKELINLPVVTLSKIENISLEKIQNAELVSGSVVISVDYFKRFVSFLRDIFGGRVGAYESLIDRARREAILRMKEKATGADIILNLKLEGAGMGRRPGAGKGAVHSVEVIAYGTAVTFVK